MTREYYEKACIQLNTVVKTLEDETSKLSQCQSTMKGLIETTTKMKLQETASIVPSLNMTARPITKKMKSIVTHKGNV